MRTRFRFLGFIVAALGFAWYSHAQLSPNVCEGKRFEGDYEARGTYPSSSPRIPAKEFVLLKPGYRVPKYYFSLKPSPENSKTLQLEAHAFSREFQSFAAYQGGRNALQRESERLQEWRSTPLRLSVIGNECQASLPKNFKVVFDPESRIGAILRTNDFGAEVVHELWLPIKSEE